MYKITREQQIELEFHTRHLSGVDFNSLLDKVSVGYQQIKSGQPPASDSILELIRGYALVRDVASLAAHSEYLEKKHGVTSEQLNRCHEIVGYFREKEQSLVNAREFFAQFTVSQPDYSNKPQAK